MISEVCNALTIADAAIKVVRTVPKWKSWYNGCKPELNIAVFGESGSGKSSFLSMLLGKAYDGESTRYNKQIKYTLPDGTRVRFHDCPGQKSYRDERQKIKEKILRGKFHAIINVVCFGYNESENTRIKMFDNTDGKVKESYLSNNRTLEIQQLEEWAKDINKRCNVKWILTLVNKADVWYDKHEDVDEYYKNGEYNNQLLGLEKICQIHYMPVLQYVNSIWRKTDADTYWGKRKD